MSNFNDGYPGLGWGGGTILLLNTQAVLDSLLGYMDLREAVTTAVMATLGATVGFFVHLFWTYVKKKHDEYTDISKESKTRTKN